LFAFVAFGGALPNVFCPRNNRLSSFFSKAFACLSVFASFAAASFASFFACLAILSSLIRCPRSHFSNLSAGAVNADVDSVEPSDEILSLSSSLKMKSKSWSSS